MVRLCRTVRFALNRDASSLGTSGHGGSPAISGLGVHAEFDIECAGFPDPATGYLINIKEIDQAVRAVLYPPLSRAVSEGALVDPFKEILSLYRPLAADLQTRFEGRLVSLLWRLIPTCSIEVAMPEHTTQTKAADQTDPTVVVLRQRCEFAASHRLHVPELGDEANRALFGKCNNPNGHGHNYVVEPAIAMTLPLGGGPPPLTVPMLEDAVERAILSRFDHKHLNLDTEEFGEGGLNPSVENISKVCFGLLAAELAGGAGGTKGIELRSLTVWETERTSCTYPG